jgi:serine/threonine protein kinase
MSTFISEPGTKLGGRYRLEDRLAAAAGWSAWKAIDETLARAVTVLTFAAGFPRIAEVVTAARAASRLPDSRLARVFDVEDDWDHAYIVMEWASGDTLADLLTGGMDLTGGARIVAEAASALASAHAAGLAHLCLTPDSLRWTPGSGLKVTGLGLDAALAGITADNPELADTVALGRLLYASLTGLWPGGDYPSLPPAPTSEGQLRRPRQVRAGVPAALDEVACQALSLPGTPGDMLTTPAQLAAALHSAIPPSPVPPATLPGRRDAERAPARQSPDPYWQREGADSRRNADTWAGSDRGGAARGGARRTAGPGGSRTRVALVALLTLVAVTGVAAATVKLWPSHKPGQNASSGHSHSTNPSPGASLLTPVGASGFDAERTPAQDPGNEDSVEAPNVLKDNGQGWDTQWYASPEFGGLKTGTGFILDMGGIDNLGSVAVTFGKVPGATVQIKVGDSPTRSLANLDSMKTVGSATDVSGLHVFTMPKGTRAQYIVVWFTKLPPEAGTHGHFLGQIFSIAVKGNG